MKNEHIKQLINRYMQGQTTLDEERELAQWFRSHNVDDDWKPYQQMFAWFDEGMPQQEGLLQEPHSPNASEIPTGETAHSEPAQKSLRIVHVGRVLWTAVAAAAVAAVVWMVWPAQQTQTPTVKSPMAQTVRTQQKSELPVDVADTTAQRKLQPSKSDSLKNDHGRKKARFREYRRFHRSMVSAETLLAEAHVDSVIQARQAEIENEVLRRQLVSILIDQHVDDILNYQQYCLENALYENEQDEQTDKP